MMSLMIQGNPIVSVSNPLSHHNDSHHGCSVSSLQILCHGIKKSNITMFLDSCLIHISKMVYFLWSSIAETEIANHCHIFDRSVK